MNRTIQPRPAGRWAVGTVLAVVCLAAASSGAHAQDATPPPGFTTGAAAEQRALEERFRAVPSSRSARRTAAWLARTPHLAGTPQTRALADRLAAEMEGLGFDVSVERYDVYLPHPLRTEIALVSPERVPLETREPDAGERPEGAPPYTLAWNAYAANGAVEAPVVYANYGRAEDFAVLDRLGVDVDGAIVLARYGGVFRGVKVREAEARGAAGVVLYSDPAEDGYAAGDTLPVGPYRPARAVQRGTVKYLWRYTGDPLTPGEPARPGVPRLDPEEAIDLPGIPVAPIGYGAASEILRRLSGPEPPEAFRGALDAPYRLGGEGVRLRLAVEQEYATRTIRNVIARLPGRTAQEVVIGNHYDAWAYGGVDAHSGTTAVLELARGLARLADAGWTPRRGITLAFWDAEEYGAVGSTEWVEHRLDRLRETAVAYFNIDVFTAGALDLSGSPSLRALVRSAAAAVDDPVTGRPLLEGWAERWRDDGDGPSAPVVRDLGAGSDWTAFFHFAGVPSLQWTMNGRGTYAVYHSVLDDFDYYAEHADSAFVHTPAMARVMGVAALRLAEAEALPFRYTRYAERIGGYVDALDAEIRAAGGAVGEVDLVAVRRRLAAFSRAADRAEARQREALAAGDTAALREIDRALPRVEQAFLGESGLPDRPWYRHRIYAPGRRTGYAARPLPGPREALEASDAGALERALRQLAAALGRAEAVLSRAAS